MINFFTYDRFAQVNVDNIYYLVYTKKFLQYAYENPIISIVDRDSWGEPTAVVRRVVCPMIPTKQVDC